MALLDKNLYGTVDGAYNWAETLNKSRTAQGYHHSQADQLVRAQFVDGEHTVTGTYTDDVTGMNTTHEGYQKAVADLGKDGEANNIIGLGITCSWENGTLIISQQPFLLRVLKRFGMQDCAPKYTPLSTGYVLSKMQCPTTTEEHTEMANHK